MSYIIKRLKTFSVKFYCWRVLASSPVNSSARLVGTVGGAVTFAVRHLEKEALSNQTRSGRIEEGAWRRGQASLI